jgi:drug/metabolite transporter (DMT)-like permease
MSKNYTVRDWLLLGFISFAWGSADILAKKGLKVFSPNEMGCIRMFVASLFFLPLILIRLKHIKFIQIEKLLIIGLLGSVLPAFIFARSQGKLDSSIHTALSSLTPIFTLLFAVFLFRRLVKRNEIVGIAMGCIGTIILISGVIGSSQGDIKYVIFPILGSICYALSTNLVSHYMKNINTVTATAVSLMPYSVIMGLVIFTKTEVISKLENIEGAYTALGCAIAVAICSSALAFLSFNILTHNTSSVFASMSKLVAPVVSIMWGLLDGENLLLTHYIGIFIILSGVYLLNKRTVSDNIEHKIIN